MDFQIIQINNLNEQSNNCFSKFEIHYEIIFK